MKRLLYIIVIIAFFMKCSAESKSESSTIEKELNEQITTNNNFVDSGGKIDFTIVDSSSIIQRIEKQRDNIIYRITKVDSKSHLLRQGVNDINELEIALKELEKEQLFYVDFEENAKADLLKKQFEGDQYSSAIKYLTDQIQTDFILVCESDTVKPSFVNYERNFHVAPFERLLLGFSKINSSSSMELLYKDQLFRKGVLKFSFPSNSRIINKSDFVL